jgi:hypothetical protein
MKKKEKDEFIVLPRLCYFLLALRTLVYLDLFTAFSTVAIATIIR